MCWLFVVKVLLMWDYIRLHHYYIRYTSGECTVGWTMSNMLTPCCESSGPFPITSCSHEISGSPYVFTFRRRRVWEWGYFLVERLRYSSHIPECIVLTGTRMKNHAANIDNVSASLLHQNPGEWDYNCKVLEICHSLIPRPLHSLQHYI